MSVPNADRPVASVSIDVDDLWTYLRTHGDLAWASRPTYLPVFVPRLLDALDEVGATITCFLVGEDAARDEAAELFRRIADAGHEIANHTHRHEVWLDRYSAGEADEELARAEAAIVAATGRSPVGFRAPGFAWSPVVLDRLARRGYRYDASTLPTFLGPLARRYFLRSSRLTADEAAERGALFGPFAEGFRPLRPYHWALGDGRRLLEIPVTTVPGVRTPFHLSYVLALAATAGERVALAYLRAALALCRAARVEPSFLLHPPDLLGPTEAPGLQFFPGMGLSAAAKRRLFVRALGTIAQHFTLVPMIRHAERAERAAAARGTAVAATPRGGRPAPSPDAGVPGA